MYINELGALTIYWACASAKSISLDISICMQAVTLNQEFKNDTGGLESRWLVSTSISAHAFKIGEEAYMYDHVTNTHKMESQY